MIRRRPFESIDRAAESTPGPEVLELEVSETVHAATAQHNATARRRTLVIEIFGVESK
jgi:hypothetical protein